MGKSFRPGVGNIADFTEGKLRKKIIQYSLESDATTATNVGDVGATGIFKEAVGVTQLQFKSLATGSNMVITDDDAGTVTVNLKDDVTIADSLTVTGQLDANGHVNLGNATADTVTVTGRFDSDLVPSTDSARDLGTSALQWAELHVDTGNIDQLGSALDANNQNITNVNTFEVDGAATFNGNVTAGNAVSDVTTVTGRLTASIGALISGRLGIGHNAAEEELDVVGDARVIKNSNSAGARAKVTIAKSRGTFGSEAVVQNGDTIGELQFDGYDGNSYEEFASIYAKADAAVGDGDTPGALYFATTADGASSATQRAVITSTGETQLSGNLWMSDDKKLYFGNNADAYVEYNENGDDFLVISGSADGIVLSGSTVQIAGTLEGASPLKIAGGVEIVSSANGDDSSWTFGNGPVEFSGSFVATSDDTVLHFGDMHHCGIFCASGSWNDSWMDVSGSNITLSGSLISATGRIGVGIQLESGAITHGITLPNTDNVYGKIKANAYTTYSSQRYKNNIEPIQGAMDKVRNLSGVTYNWNTSNSSDIGFIAEDVGKIMPEIVEWESDGVNAQSMDYTRIIPVVVEAIKDQQKQIDQLQKEIDKIKK